MKDGSNRYMFQAYLGTDEMTGKRIRVTRQGFVTRKDAQLELSRLKLEVADGGFQKKNYETFGELYEMWFENVYRGTVKESTRVKTVQLFNNHILPAFKDLRVEKITVVYCQKMVNEWSGKLTKQKTMTNYVKRILDYAINLGMIKDNPMKKVIQPRISEDITEGRKISFYEKEDLEKFLNGVKEHPNPRWFPLFRLLAFTGMRKGEALALQWKDINFVEGSLRINKGLARGEDNTLIIQTPKTRASVRTLSLDPITIGILKEWRVRQATDYIKLGMNTNSPNQYVFTNLKNEFVQHANLTQVMNRTIKMYNLPKIVVHNLRNTHCSLLFEAGASIQAVKERLGHSDIQTTMNIYSAVTKGEKEKTADLFAKHVGF